MKSIFHGWEGDFFVCHFICMFVLCLLFNVSNLFVYFIFLLYRHKIEQNHIMKWLFTKWQSFLSAVSKVFISWVFYDSVFIKICRVDLNIFIEFELLLLSVLWCKFILKKKKMKRKTYKYLLTLLLLSRQCTCYKKKDRKLLFWLVHLMKVILNWHC